MYCETQSRTKNIAQFVPGVRFLARQRDSYTPFLRRVNCAFTIALPPVFPYLRTRISTPKPFFVLCLLKLLSFCPYVQKRTVHHTTFVSSPIQFTIHLWKFVEGYHITFVTVFIPPSFYQIFPTTCQSTNSKISHFSQLSQLSQLSTFSTFSRLSRLSRLSRPSQKFHPSLPSPKIHGSFNDN